MRLFLMWYMTLMDNATEDCHRTFTALVPKLGSDEALDIDVFTVRSPVDSMYYLESFRSVHM